MKTFSERLKASMDAKGMSQSELARAIGVKPQAIQYLCAVGTRSVHTVKIAAILGVDPEWLTDGKGGAGASNAEPGPILGKFSQIPVVGRAQLGDNAHWAEMEYPVGHGDGYIDYPTRDENAYALLCRGDSMKPRIRDGEFVVVEPNSKPQNGDEVLVKAKDGRVMVKTLLYERDGRVHLLSTNEAHPPQSLPLDEIDKMHLVAAIVKKALWHPG